MSTFIDRIINDFGRAIGIPELCFDEEGLCFLTIDDERPLIFRQDIENTRLTLVGELADALPATSSNAWTTMALSCALNPMTGQLPGIGIDKTSGKVIAYWHITSNLLTIDTLKAKVGQFIEWQKQWVIDAQQCLIEKDPFATKSPTAVKMA